MAESFAKLPRKLWDLADAKERNRRILRPETYRGALADLCIAIDNSRDKSIDYNPRYWGMRWEWHRQEVQRFLDDLISTGLFSLIQKPNERGQRIIASFYGCDQVVTSLCQKCDQPFQHWQGVGGAIVTSLCQGCGQNVTKVPTTNLSLLPPSGGSPPPAAKSAVPYQKIVEIYHELLPVLAQCKILSPARKALIRSRWKEDPDRQCLEWWREFFSQVAASDFLCGRVTPRPGRPPFLADLEWLVRPSNFILVLEGRYNNYAGVREVVVKIIEVCGNCYDFHRLDNFTNEKSCADRQLNDERCGSFQPVLPAQVRVKG